MSLCLPGISDEELLDERTALFEADAFEWLAGAPENTFHAVVTDPPYGLVEYGSEDQRKLREGRGGVWRIPPALDGVRRRPLPRFTVLTAAQRVELAQFFTELGHALHRVCVPGAHVFLASNPLLSTLVFGAFSTAGWEKRAEIVRLVQTLRGGDRPKGAEEEFADVTVMPRSAWEPWGLFRKPCEGTVADNLRRWGTGALRRPGAAAPFCDVIRCAPTHARERALAPHPSLKPQRFLRQIVRAAVPVDSGLLLDPFAGSGSTLAAAAHLGLPAVGIERDAAYVQLAREAFPALRDLVVSAALPGQNHKARVRGRAPGMERRTPSTGRGDERDDD